MSIAKLSDLRTRNERTLHDAAAAIDGAHGDKEQLEAHKAYHLAFDEHCKLVASVLAEEEAAVAALEDAATQAERDAQAAEDEQAALQREYDGLESKDAKPAAGSKDIKKQNGTLLANFLKERAALRSRLAVTSAIVKLIRTDAVKAFALPDDEAAKLADEWDNVAKKFEDEVTQILGDADALKQSQKDLAEDAEADEVNKMWDALKGDASGLRSAADEHRDRKQSNENAVKEFEFERKRVLLWCRQQKTNLDALVEPDHIQEFCASLLNNYPAMEENFNIIYERSLPLLPSNDIQSALLEANEVWLNLQVCAYDRLRHTLLEIHHNSKLEDEVRAFSTYSQRTGAFLVEFSRLLATPTDPDSDRVVKPVSDQCASLLKQFDAHKQLADHMREFALRMECFRDNYQSLKRAVLSRLTFLAVTPTLTTSQRRKDEYISRMRDLRNWVEAKSQGESWAQIHQRVLKIADLIEQEQASLSNPAGGSGSGGNGH